eukprot:CAMPEP_0182827764 /NCGR_PEP_ID=MMETSP0006_2-20121128/17103_1 /TAXON_ID=97485 /ORGANISM="Prymnesium parvum, Strain Texoma1" /LENGTH=69 /DNA_ID=CAMNT_0024955061 /DNA_START=155 /DNA_END=364 /DNA_ORIENTATION=-
MFAISTEVVKIPLASIDSTEAAMMHGSSLPIGGHLTEAVHPAACAVVMTAVVLLRLLVVGSSWQVTVWL